MTELKKNGFNYWAKMVLALAAVLAGLVAAVWGSSIITFTPVSHVSKASAEAIKRIEADYVKHSELVYIKERMDRIENKMDRMIELQIEQSQRRER